MAGLGMAQQQPQAAPPMAAQAPQAAPPAGGEEMAAAGSDGEVSPEEQALYDQFVKTALYMIIYPEGQEGASPEILDNLRGNFDEQAVQMFAEAQPPIAPSPQDSVSVAAVLITLMVDAMGQQEGVDYPDDVVQHAGVAIVEELIEVSEAAKIYEFPEEEMDGILFRAIDLFRISSPRVDPEALKAQFGTLAQASKDGTLNNVLPGLPGGAAMNEGA